METNERQMIEKESSSNQGLRRLYEEHKALEEKLSRFGRMSFLTPREEVEEKKLKLRKLRGVERMMKIDVLKPEVRIMDRNGPVAPVDAVLDDVYTRVASGV